VAKKVRDTEFVFFSIEGRRLNCLKSNSVLKGLTDLLTIPNWPTHLTTYQGSGRRQCATDWAWLPGASCRESGW